MNWNNESDRLEYLLGVLIRGPWTHELFEEDDYTAKEMADYITRTESWDSVVNAALYEFCKREVEKMRSQRTADAFTKAVARARAENSDFPGARTWGYPETPDSLNQS